MGKMIAIFVTLFIFLLGGCATFQGMAEDSRLAWKKMRGAFSKGDSADSNQIREAQSQLKARGYHSGSVDGIMGPQTVSALRRYQAANGLTVTGKADPQTLESLGAN